MGIRGGNLRPTATQYNRASHLSLPQYHSVSHIHYIPIGHPTMGSFDNSQHQAKYSHVRRLASLNIYSRIINLASLGVGLRYLHSLQ